MPSPSTNYAPGISKLSSDPSGYDPSHTEFYISDGRYAAAQDSYLDDSQWLEFARNLQSFPGDLASEVIFGGVYPEAAYYIFLRAFIFDEVGHAALEIRIARNGDEVLTAKSHFSIRCEVATLNRLGSELQRWIESGDNEFEFRAKSELR